MKANLHGQSRHHAGGSARARGDAAVLHRQIRQRGQPQPQFRLGGGERGREGPQADGGPDRRQPRKRSFSPAARPNRTTWRSRAWPRCMPRRATTSSRRRPSTRRFSIPASSWRKHGCRVTYLPVKADGLVDLDSCATRSRTRRSWSRIMYANNEIGVIQPVAEIGKICQGEGRPVPHRRACRRSARFR